ncbi:hypothetical protein HA402_000485 [Bradysia odoriphaga]|nr:hypothetical protein HA402_000485 [Bradysia odoriphaga]
MNLICLTMAPNTRVTRKWEVFAGRNKFYCDGYLMSAPNTGVFYLTVVLITVTSVLFFAFDCPYLTLEINPAIPIVGGLLYFFTMGALFRTTFTDPGIIPRASHDEAAYIEKQIEVPNSLNSPTYRPPPRTKEVLVKGQTVKLKYCFTCKIFRPPRASHCSLCDNCVDRFDHHCPWVGNCVGKRNYRFFYMFIVSLAFLTVFIFACSLTHLILLAKATNQEFVEIIKMSPASVVIIFICFFSIWSVIGLAGFHTYLTTSDQTTNEDIKGSFSSKGAQHNINPYSHGNICMNCFYIVCGPMTPSLIDRRGIVTDEYRVQMQQPERYNNAMQTAHLVSQSIGSNDNKYYDKELHPNLINSGIYRQRSYDNLQNGHSTSNAHLVDNELPVSTLHSPADPMNLTPTDDNDVDDDDGLENLSNRNNLSGSYSNLFRDILDDDDCKLNSTEQKVHQKDLSENVYSNIPSTTTIPVGDNSEKSDPNLHVYSNIVETTAGTSSSENLNKSTSGNVDATIADGSSTMIANDLDLDDPALAVATFGMAKPKDSSKVVNEKMIKSTKVDRSSLNNKRMPKSSSMEMKNVIPQVAIVDQSSNSVNGSSTTTTVNASFCSPSRMRLLHDTTMIDTALDLDSLDDGSSVGNNSQACLVKTAIV